VDIEGFPCRQLYKQNGALFWDLDYLHPALVHHGAEKHKFHWLSQVDKACSDVLFPFLVGTTRVHTARGPSDRLAANTCTTLALVAYLWHTILGARLNPIADCCRDYLVRIAGRACKVIPVDGVSLLPREEWEHTWENNLAVCLTMQRIPPERHMTRLDQTNMPLEIAVLAAKRKLERVAAVFVTNSISSRAGA
jgi:hypothetical protein